MELCLNLKLIQSLCPSYVYVYIIMHLYIYVYEYIYTHIYTYISTNIHIYTYRLYKNMVMSCLFTFTYWFPLRFLNFYQDIRNKSLLPISQMKFNFFIFNKIIVLLRQYVLSKN